MPTVAEIAAEAFDSVSEDIPDAIHAAVMTWETNGAYNPVTGAYDTVPASASGRVVEDSTTPVNDVFDDYVAGPAEVLVLMEGFTFAPKENRILSYAGRSRTIMKAQDIVAAGTVFYVVAR